MSNPIAHAIVRRKENDKTATIRWALKHYRYHMANADKHFAQRNYRQAYGCMGTALLYLESAARMKEEAQSKSY